MHKQGALREFGHYAAMNILGMIGISCYILADTYFVAQGLGSLGLAALNIADDMLKAHDEITRLRRELLETQQKLGAARP